MNDVKRLFFGFRIQAPWPDEYPHGRILDEQHRHLTVAFLGNVPYEKISSLLPALPKPPFKVGLAGKFDKCLLLPPRFPHVIAWHVDWIDNPNALLDFQKLLATTLRENDFHIDKREFLSHVTLCRSPFDPKKWKQAFKPLPCIATDFHLFESRGNMHYEPLWTHAIRAPFEEIEHTADIAYVIRGESLSQLYFHAQIALAFRYPQLLDFFSQNDEIQTLEEIVVNLNTIVTKVDSEIGCPFKAVSFHGNLVYEQDNTLHWEMIVDV